MTILIIASWIISLFLVGYISWKIKPQTIQTTENVTMDLSPWLVKPIKKGSKSEKEKLRGEAWELARDQESDSRRRIYDLDGNPWVIFKCGLDSVTTSRVVNKGYSLDANNVMVLKWNEFDNFFPEYRYMNPDFKPKDEKEEDSYVKVKPEEFEALMKLRESQSGAFAELQELLA